MAANNEIGTIQPVAELGKICRERGSDVSHRCGAMVREGAVCRYQAVSMRILFPFAPTNFMVLRERVRFSSNRRCFRSRFYSAAVMRTSDAPAQKTCRRIRFRGGFGTICEEASIYYEKLRTSFTASD